MVTTKPIIDFLNQTIQAKNTPLRVSNMTHGRKEKKTSPREDDNERYVWPGAIKRKNASLCLEFWRLRPQTLICLLANRPHIWYGWKDALYRNRIVFTNFRLILNQTEFCSTQFNEKC